MIENSTWARAERRGTTSIKANSAYVFIGGLHNDMTEGDVITVFSQYGEVMDVNLPRDKTTGKQRGFGFLMYEDQRSTVLAVDNLNGAQVLGRTLRVDHVQNYKQPKVKGEDGELAEATEQSLNAKPELIREDEGEESDDGSVSSAPSIDPEDPMASYLLQKRREEKSRAKGKSKEKSKHKHDRANETPEERRLRKERKRAKREAKEAKRDRPRDRPGERRDHSGDHERRDRDRSTRRPERSPRR
ncbi:Zinc finger CCCH domain-containing protein 25 [Ceratobasidium theobromae]|uniref:Zinc finger CCCH domain-containing protein 25 n=1 Tax=Ceratobasidium theobromae TaxID=1582974 RepID=A0A5N5QSA9_9AGAM|nr:Zinc finger CCCH domain-containing protein 25 [Ceratobasidium theobromae]